MPGIPDEIGERVRSLRLKRGLTQSKLANASDISRISISRIEGGYQKPSLGQLQRLARALNTSLKNLGAEFLSSKQYDRQSNQIKLQRIEPIRQRLTLDISPDFDSALKDLSKHQSTSKPELVRQALQTYFENIGYESYFAHEDVSGQKLTRRIQVRSVKQVMFHSKLLISAFQEALDYDGQRHHNRPPPSLRLDDKEYLEELRELVTELKQMNSFLADLVASKKSEDGPPAQLRKHLDTFLNKYSSTLGYGAGVMTLGLIATLLYQLGAGEAVFDHVLKKIPG